MMIIGVDYHPSFQQIAFFVEETGECGEQELNHSDGCLAPNFLDSELSVFMQRLRAQAVAGEPGWA
jgi:hypothetical protein